MLTLVNSNRGGLQQHAESFLTLAETAFGAGHQHVARRIIEFFLQRSPQKDQYFCRASVLMGLILDYEAKATNGSESIRRRKNALSQMIVALDVATAPENTSRYAFIVFNTSVSCWRVLRTFMRAGRAKFFVFETSQISAALEKCDDRDIEWRITYLSAAALCYFDSQQTKPAEELMDKAIGHAEKLLASCMEREKIILQELQSTTIEMENATASFRELEEKDEAFRNKKKKIDPDAEEDELLAMASGETKEPVSDDADIDQKGRVSDEEFETAKHRKAIAMSRKSKVEDRLRTNNERKSYKQTLLTRLYMQRVNTNPAESKKIAGLPGAVQTLRMRTLIQLQCVSSGCIEAKDYATVFGALIKDLTVTDKPQLSTALTVETLLDVCRVAWQLELKDIALQCFDAAQAIVVSPLPVIRVKLDLCKALAIVADSASENANLALETRLTSREAEGHVISRRIEAIRLLERIIPSCEQRLKDPVLLQEICVAVWNASLPLLQPHLRKNVYRALQLVARALEDADSPLVLLRTQVHLELAKCEEQADFVGKAKDEAEKAAGVDYGVLLDVEALLTEAIDGAAAKAAGGKAADPGKKPPPDPKKGSVVSAGTGSEGAIGEELDRARPLDHVIQPLVDILTLRVSVYDLPSNVEGQVWMLLQQAKESSSVAFQADTLLKACAYMMEVITPRKKKSRRGPESTLSVTAAAALVGEAPTLDELEEVLLKPRGADQPTPAGSTPATASGAAYNTFTTLTQTRAQIMHAIAQLAQLPHQRNRPVDAPSTRPALSAKPGNMSSAIAQRAAWYVLSHVWNPADTFHRELLDDQVEAHYHLACALVDRLALHWIDPEREEEYDRDVDAALVRSTARAAKVQAGMEIDGEGAGAGAGAGAVEYVVPDPRSLGIVSKYASADMHRIKRLVLVCLQRGVALSTHLSDEVGLQNALVHFWNMHMHIFRRGLFGNCMSEVFDFLKTACDELTTQVAAHAAYQSALLGAKGVPPVKGKGAPAPTSPAPAGMLASSPVDERLYLTLHEALVGCLDARESLAEALAVAAKACAIAPPPTTPPTPPTATTITAPYLRRRLCEMACLAAARLSLSGGKNTAPPATAVAAAVNALKFDSAFLTCYAQLTLAELPADMVSREVVQGAVERAAGVVRVDVEGLLGGVDWDGLAQDGYDQVMEMRAEILTRLTRLKVGGWVRERESVCEYLCVCRVCLVYV